MARKNRKKFKQKLIALQLELQEKEAALHDSIFNSFPDHIKREFNLLDSLNRPLMPNSGAYSPGSYNKGEKSLDEYPRPKKYMGDL